MLKRVRLPWSVLPFFVPAFFSVLFFMYLGSFSRLIADDYCSLDVANKFGILRSVWFWYKSWHGCYSAALMDNLLVLSPFMVKWAPVIILGAWLAGLVWAGYLLLRGLLQGAERFWQAFSAGCLVLSGTLMLSPNLGQSYLWWGGLRSYTLSLVLVSFSIVLFLWIWQRAFGVRTRVFVFLVGLGLAFFCAGFNESMTPVLVVFWVMVTLYGTVAGWRKTHADGFYYALAAMLGAILGLVVVILAPGNTVRQASSPVPPGLVELLSISWQAYLFFMQTVLGTLLAVLLLTGVLGFSIWLGLSLPVRKMPLWAGPLALLGGFIFGFGFFPPASYGLREFLPDRCQILPVFCVVSGFVFAGVLGGMSISWRRGGQVWLRRGVYLAACGLVFAAAGLNLQKQLLNEGVLASYAAYWDETHTLILASRAAGVKDLTIHSVRNWTGLNDPGNNPKFWLNGCMSEYYGINILADDTGMQESESFLR